MKAAGRRDGGRERSSGPRALALRENLSEVQRHEGGSIKHDVAVPVSRVAEFIETASGACEAAMPGLRICAFGHVGDGNIHFNLSQPVGMDKDAFLAEWGRFNRIVHDIVHGMQGSISAEHGIGLLKRDEILLYKILLRSTSWDSEAGAGPRQHPQPRQGVAAPGSDVVKTLDILGSASRSWNSRRRSEAANASICRASEAT